MKKKKLGRPRLKEKFSERFVVMFTPKQKQKVLNEGGSAFVRSIVQDYFSYATDRR